MVAMAQLVAVREARLLGLPITPCKVGSQNTQKRGNGDDDPDGELSEEDVWEIVDVSKEKATSSASTCSSYIGASLSMKQVDKAMESSISSGRVTGSAGGDTAEYKWVLRASGECTADCVKPRKVIIGMEEAACRAAPRRNSIVSNGDEADGGDKFVPPHLMLVSSSSRRTVHSVVVGAGRTLKGRDLRNVRNSVWKHTGFFG